MSVKRLSCLISMKIQQCLTYTNARAIYVASNATSLHNYQDESSVLRHRPIISTNYPAFIKGTSRHKSTKQSKNKQNEDSDEDEDEDEDNELADNGSKVLKTRVSSMRVDLIVKAGLGMARNKAEVALYESKIRINGQKVLKKSSKVSVGDLVDLIRGPSPKNPDFLIVSRITILSATPDTDTIKLKFTRDKSLIIENYEEEWKPLAE